MLWEKKIGTGYGAPSVLGNRLVLHHRIGDEEIVECFDATDGHSLWHFGYPSQFVDPYGYNNGPRCTPLLTSNLCYTFGAEGKLTCLELQTGKLVWQRDTALDFNVPNAFFGVGSTPILESGLLLVMVGGQPNSGMVAFDPKTGKTVWESVGKKNWEGVPMTGWPGERTVQWRIFGKTGQLFHARRRDHPRKAAGPLPDPPGIGFAGPQNGRREFQLLVSFARQRFGQRHEPRGGG